MSSPLVSVVTPVYNAGPYLRDCIESVLAQTYSSWDYTIVNNCSTDGTLAVAEEYARRESRIRIRNNCRHVRVAENHNIAVRTISPESKYCKVILADDWMFPRCLTSMVQVAEAHPTVGMVGAYGLVGTLLKWHGLPYPSTVVSGRSICRASLLNELAVFGSPTTTMLRSDVIRNRDPFYNESNVHFDVEACYETLQQSDFGFVHEVLTFTRIDNESLRTITEPLNTQGLSDIYNMLKYGPVFLTDTEYERRLRELWREYYTFLAWAVTARGPEFWRFHRQKLQDLRQPFSRFRLLKAIVARAVSAALNPRRCLERALEIYFPPKTCRSAP